jgi:hypothetical protein
MLGRLSTVATIAVSAMEMDIGSARADIPPARRFGTSSENRALNSDHRRRSSSGTSTTAAGRIAPAIDVAVALSFAPLERAAECPKGETT